MHQHGAMAAASRIIVVGFDGSDVSQRALESAADLAGYGSTLTVVGMRNGGAGQTEGTLSLARERLAQRGVLASYLEPAGDPAEQLLDTAQRLNADVIVLGRRGHTAPPPLESLGDQVVRGAHCNVLLVQ
jgi:nucleotide-binding universal stress UspA family protein